MKLDEGKMMAFLKDHAAVEFLNNLKINLKSYIEGDVNKKR